MNSPFPYWKAGTARRVITPQEPMYMAGFAFRDHPSEGVRHDLWAKVLVLEDAEGTRVVFICADIIGFSATFCDEIGARVETLWDVPRKNLVFNASHTHSGPMLSDMTPTMQPTDEAHLERIAEYTAWLANTLTELIGEALGHLEPALVSYGQGVACFAVNRRLPTPNGYINACYPEGPSDFDVPVLQVTTPDGALHALLCGYACHTTVLSDYQISGDWVGYAQLELEAKYPDAQAMFMMLCGADQNSLPRGDVLHAQTYGAQLAHSVTRTLSRPLQPLSGAIRIAYETISLDLQAHSREIFEARLHEEHGQNPWRKRHAENVLQSYDKGSPMQAIDYPVQTVALGDQCTLLALSGEVVVDYSLRAKRELGIANLIVAGYCNGIMAYIPSRRVLDEGGYEGGESMIYFGPPMPFAHDVEERIFAAIGRVTAAIGR
jgi:hypothetical protein